MSVLVYGLNLTFYGTSAVNSVHYLACSMFLFVFVKKYPSSFVMISCTFANNVMSPSVCNKPTTESFLEKNESFVIFSFLMHTCKYYCHVNPYLSCHVNM
jgi:hypothetical protein